MPLLFALCIFLLYPTLADAAEPAAFAASGRFCDAIWTDGEDRLIASCYGYTESYTRDGKQRDILGPRRVAQLDGVGRGAGIVVAAVTEGGTAARLVAGHWQEGSPPDRDRLVVAAVDASARTWFAGERALHLWQGDQRWTAHRYPAGARVVYAARGDGGLYLATRDGRILHADGRGVITALPIPGRTDSGDDSVKGLWFSQRSRKLYLLHRIYSLTVVDRRSGAITTTQLADWGVGLTGFDTSDGELVAIAVQGSLVGLSEGRLYRLTRTSYSFVHQLTYNAKDGRLYVAAQDGIGSHSLATLRSPTERAKLEEVGERSGRSSGITVPGRLVLLSGGLALGPSWDHLEGIETTRALTLDLELGLRMPFAMIARRTIALWPTLGYSYDAHGATGGHRFVGGLGLTFFLTRNLLLGVTLASRLVAGSVGETRALGVRSGLRLELFLGVLAVDVAHQALYTERTIHGARLTFGLDVVHMLRVLRFFRFLAAPSWSGAKGVFGGLLR